MNNSIVQRISAKQSKRLEKLRNDEGFSLLELVTAVGVLLILVIVGLSSYNAVQKNSKQSATNKAVDEVYGKAFATLVDEDASTNPLQVQEEYNKSSKNVRVSVEELGNDRITVRAFLPNGENGEEEFVVTKTTPAVGGSEDTGTTPPVEGGDETTPPIIGNTFSTAIMRCDDTTTAQAPFAGFASGTEITVQEVGKPETFRVLETQDQYEWYHDLVLENGGSEEDFKGYVQILEEGIKNSTGLDISFKDWVGHVSEPATYEAGVEYEIKIDGTFNIFDGKMGGKCLRTAEINENSGVVQLAYGDGVESVQENLPSSVRDLSSAFLDGDINDPNIAKWDVSKVMNMNSMFNGTTSFNQDLSDWDVSSVVSMQSMFTESAFNNGGQPLDWGNKTKNVKNMGNMFNKTAFNQDISGWDVSSVDNVETMFKGNKAFNNGGQPLTWGDRTRNFENINQMFSGATSFNQDISGWDVSSVTTMKNMFRDASSFNNGGAALTWGEGTRNVTDMSYMFYNASSFNQDISGWDVSSVTTMEYMFSGTSSFDNGGAALTWGEGTRNVTNMSYMFYNTSSFNQDISSWDVSSVTTMNRMFRDASSFNNGGTALTWGEGTRNVTNMFYMFYNASSFNQDISSWDVSKFTSKPLNFNNNAPFASNSSFQPQWGKV